jgi:hypothetical protein
MKITQSPATVFTDLWHRIPRDIKSTFVSAFILGLLTHAYMLTNKLPEPDDVDVTIGLVSTHANGRWFLHVPDIISSTFSLPWANGLLALTYLSVAVCLVVACLRIGQSYYRFFAAGLMVTIPTIGCTLMFMFTVDTYMFSIMLACLAAFLAVRYKFGYIAAIVPLVLSMGIYQAYYAVTCGILVIVLILEILDNQVTWQKTLYKGLRFIILLGVSMAAYLIIVKITAPPGALRPGMEDIGRIELSELPYLILKAYLFIAEYFLLDLRLGIHYPFMPALFAVAFVLGGVLLVMLARRQNISKQPMKLALLCVLVILLPLACNIIYVMDPGTWRILTIYATVFAPVFLVVLADRCKVFAEQGQTEESVPSGKRRRPALIVNFSCWAISVVLALNIFNSFIVTNQLYFKLHFVYETSYAQSVEFVSRIRNTEGYTADKQIVMVGTPKAEIGLPQLDSFMYRNTFNSYLSAYNFPTFLRNYLGFTQQIEWQEDRALVDPQISAVMTGMPQYPDDGSIALVDDVIYVNFPDKPESLSFDSQRDYLAHAINIVRNALFP